MTNNLPPSLAQLQRAMVDTHCHIDLYPQPENVIAEIEANGIYTIAVTNAPSVFHYTADLTKHSKYIRAAAGLHPELVHSHGKEIDLLWPLLDQTRYVGEVGLDHTTTDESIRLYQRNTFVQILDRCSVYGNKVLTVHSRRAAGQVISLVGKNYPGKVILHWFSGSKKELQQAINFDLYFSVNSAMLSSQKGQSLIAEMPPDRILTESDGPFVSIAKTPASPLHINKVLENLAACWQLSVEETSTKIITNFRNLLAST